MGFIRKENLLVAKQMYKERIYILEQKIIQTVERGLAVSNPSTQNQEVIIGILDDIDQELTDIQDCVGVLNYLLK